MRAGGISGVLGGGICGGTLAGRWGRAGGGGGPGLGSACR